MIPMQNQTPSWKAHITCLLKGAGLKLEKVSWPVRCVPRTWRNEYSHYVTDATGLRIYVNVENIEHYIKLLKEYQTIAK